MENHRCYGMDAFRIMCCLGVLTYHTMQYAPSVFLGGMATLLYYGASFCVPGFFLLSGYLLGRRQTMSREYIEQKLTDTIAKLILWVAFWIIAFFILSGEVKDLWENVALSFNMRGILPVAWFLFPYCIFLVLAYPLWYICKKSPMRFTAVSFMWILFLEFAVRAGQMKSGVQSRWLCLYFAYFMLGMALSYFFEWLTARVSWKIQFSTAGVFALLGAVVFAKSIYADAFQRLPDFYYGRWFYSIWLLCLFWVCKLLPIRSGRVQRYLAVISKNTLVVYLGHLPVLQKCIQYWPIDTTWKAIVYLVVLFIGFEILAEGFKKMPLFRKLV